MKTAELTGALLDLWVARAEGWRVVNDFGGPCWADAAGKKEYVAAYQPSTNWAQGGPLIDKHGLNLLDKAYLRGTEHAKNGTWLAYKTGAALGESSFGETVLVAICRAVVRATYGDEVPDEI